MSLKTRIAKRLILNYITPDWMQHRKKNKGSNALMWAAAGAGAFFAAREISRRLTEYDLRGRSVLITGGSRGLGLVMAREFLREGARVAICARDEDELQVARNDLQQYGENVFAMPCDLTDPAQVSELVEAVRYRFGKIDVLVNNAGIITVAPVEDMTLADYEEAMLSNYWSAVHTTLALLPEMQVRKDGRIVNISSIGGKIAVPHLLPYSASKFALVGFSEGLRAEVKKDGVVVTTVVPGLMRTGSPRNANFKGRHRKEYAWFTISDASLLTSISAESAARQIINACKRGDGEVVLSIQAKLAVAFHSLFPEVTTDLMSFVNRLLPKPGGIGVQTAKGYESESSLTRSWLTSLDEEAARENNQMKKEDGKPETIM